MATLEAPQLVTTTAGCSTSPGSRPTPTRSGRSCPRALELADGAQCFINQYVVDATEQTSGFEAYSLTYAGADLKGHDSPDGAVRGTGGPTTSTRTPTCAPTRRGARRARGAPARPPS